MPSFRLSIWSIAFLFKSGSYWYVCAIQCCTCRLYRKSTYFLCSRITRFFYNRPKKRRQNQSGNNVLVEGTPSSQNLFSRQLFMFLNLELPSKLKLSVDVSCSVAAAGFLELMRCEGVYILSYGGTYFPGTFLQYTNVLLAFLSHAFTLPFSIGIVAVSCCFFEKVLSFFGGINGFLFSVVPQ